MLFRVRPRPSKLFMLFNRSLFIPGTFVVKVVCHPISDRVGFAWNDSFGGAVPDEYPPTLYATTMYISFPSTIEQPISSDHDSRDPQGFPAHM